MKLTLIGYGAFGSALANVLMENGHELSIYDPIKFPRMDLKTAVDFGSAIIFAAPSATLEQTVSALISQNSPALSRPFIIASKGFTSLTPMLGLKKPIIMSGPAFSSDLKNRLPATFTVTSVFAKHLFERPYLSFDISHDRLGVLLCGSLKNLFAIYAGYRHIRPSTSTFRAFLIESVAEEKLILEVNHCSPDTANLSCGFRDLAITSCTKKSRNYSYGYVLKDSETAEAGIKKLKSLATVEGLSAYNSLKSSVRTKTLILPHEEDIPLLAETLALVKSSRPAKKIKVKLLD